MCNKYMDMFLASIINSQTKAMVDFTTYPPEWLTVGRLEIEWYWKING